MAAITLPPPTPQSESARALRSSYLCYFLAMLAMCVIGWFVIEGIEATAPNSSARYAKIAGGVLQMILGGYVFSLASQNKEGAFSLRALGWSIFALNIVMATLANYAINASAGKDAALSNATVAEIRAQADDSRKAAQTLRESAVKLNKSKHGFLNEQGGKVSTEAAQQTAAAAGAAEKLEKMRSSLTSTPMIEIIGEKWMMALSLVQALILELCNIVLMHHAGIQRRKALVGGLPVEYQILELLQEMRGTAPVPAPALAPAPATPFSFLGFKAAPATRIPAPAPAPATPDQDSAPAPAAPAPAPAPTVPVIRPFWLEKEFGFVGVKVPKKAPAADDSSSAKRVNDDTPERVNDDTPVPMKTDVSAPVNGDVFTGSERVNDDTPKAPTKARKERVARDSAVMDSGTGPLDGFRYRRAVAGVKAGKIQTTIIGMYDGVGVSAPAAKRFLEAMADAGVVVRKGNRYALAEKYRLKLAKKGGAK